MDIAWVVQISVRLDSELPFRKVNMLVVSGDESEAIDEAVILASNIVNFDLKSDIHIGMGATTTPYHVYKANGMRHWGPASHLAMTNATYHTPETEYDIMRNPY